MRKILVLGAGGAARAAVFGLKERGAEVYILNRSVAPAQKLARQAQARIIKRADLKKLTFDVIINATPVGMGNTRESPLNEDEIKARYRLRYGLRPAETRLLKLAKARGAEVIPGIEMFVHQAARQFEIWTGKPAPWDDMLRVVTKALAERPQLRRLPLEKTDQKASKSQPDFFTQLDPILPMTQSQRLIQTIHSREKPAQPMLRHTKWLQFPVTSR